MFFIQTCPRLAAGLLTTLTAKKLKSPAENNFIKYSWSQKELIQNSQWKKFYLQIGVKFVGLKAANILLLVKR